MQRTLRNCFDNRRRIRDAVSLAGKGRRLSLGGVQGGASAGSATERLRNGTEFLSTSTTRCARSRPLRERERELSQLVDVVPAFIWRQTPDGEPTFFNKRLIDFLGLDVADADSPDMSRRGGDDQGRRPSR